MGRLKIFRLFILLISLGGFSLHAQKNTAVFSAGSVIINMGQKPQTPQNALKPYGLLYDLLQNHEVDVTWLINPEKEKDAIDFSIEGTDFRSGAFLIPVSYLSDEVKQSIRRWEKEGVITFIIENPVELPVFSHLSIPPKWTLDKENGAIAVPFFKSAGIPDSAYGGTKVSGWKTPEELGVCDDIFVLPHADPEFNTHKNLFFWNKKYKGAIWAGCHAASILENLSGKIPGEKSEEIIQLNFLSAGFAGARSAGLVNFFDHRHGTPPYKNAYPADPVSQYLGSPDGAHINGSERIFFPKKINRWRPEAKILVFDPDAPDIPDVSNGEAVVSIYGHGFGDPERGLVMYQAGHSIFGETEDHIAALRSFFNWSFYAAEIKRKENFISFKNRYVDERTVGARIGDDLTDILNLDPIHFDLDKAEIRKEVMPQLSRIADFMIENPEILMDIRSHTDSRANDAYNLRLSNRRVRATRRFLKERGVQPQRISGRGYGETELVNHCSNGVDCNEIQHEANRRSEFILSVDCRIYDAEEDWRLK